MVATLASHKMGTLIDNKLTDEIFVKITGYPKEGTKVPNISKKILDDVDSII